MDTQPVLTKCCNAPIDLKKRIDGEYAEISFWRQECSKCGANLEHRLKEKVEGIWATPFTSSR